MVNQLVTIAEAAGLASKSAQTIRRLIKHDKIKCRRKRTPQGFNYMVDKASLLEYFGLIQPKPEVKEEEYIEEEDFEPVPEEKTDTEPEIYVLDGDEEVREEVNKVEEHVLESTVDSQQSTEDGTQYTAIIEKLLDQHQSDKEKLYSLVEAFQQRVVTLEEQIKMLQAPKKKWWQFFK